ncbi:MAG: chemotaxis protein CheX [Nitrospirales bacterium]
MQKKQSPLSQTCIDAFSLATQSMLLEMTDTSSKQGVMSRGYGFQPSHEVVVFIDLTGAIEGVFVLSVTKNMAVYIASKMMGISSMTSDDEAMDSAMIEFCNVTAGQALISLEHNGLSGVTISTPTIFYGSFEKIPIEEEAETATMHVDTQLGAIEMWLSTAWENKLSCS